MEQSHNLAMADKSFLGRVRVIRLYPHQDMFC